jgi:hypothetical protein
VAIQYCVVCGRGADRTWNTIVSGFVACDFHSISQVLAVVSTVSDPSRMTPGPNVDNTDAGVQESDQA